jgi:hypothetical protein
MTDFTRALAAYKTYDPSGWVALYRVIPMGVGIALAVAGGVLLLFGSGKLLRFVAAPLGAAVAFFLAPVVAQKLNLGMPAGQVALAAAVAVGVLGLALPAGALFVAVGLPAGLVGGQLAGPSDWLLGFAPAFVVAGLVAALLSEQVGALVSAAVGAWVLVIGLLSALHPVRGISQTLAAQPMGVLAAAGFFAMAGAVFQLSRPPPEEVAQMKQQKREAKKRAQEQRALEKRWAKYSSGGKD